jgi:hypothetical protein
MAFETVEHKTARSHFTEMAFETIFCTDKGGKFALWSAIFFEDAPLYARILSPRFH